MKTKKIFKALIASIAFFAATTFFTSTVQAQILFSAGVELGVPMSPSGFSDLASMMAGISIGGEYEVSDNIAVDAQVGFVNIFIKSDFEDFFDSWTSIPAQLGGRYYFNGVGEGVYVRPTVGVHSSSIKSKSPFGGSTSTASNTDLSYGLGIGIIVNELIDIALRYNMITASEDGADDLGYLGVRAAYNINKK